MSTISVRDDQGNVYTPASPGEATDPQIEWMTVRGHSLRKKGTLLACAAITGPQKTTLSRAPYEIVTPGDQGKLEPVPGELFFRPPITLLLSDRLARETGVSSS